MCRISLLQYLHNEVGGGGGGVGGYWKLRWFYMLIISRGGDTLIISYIRRLGSFFFLGGGGVKFLISIFFEVFRKINIEDFVDIFFFFFWGGGDHKIGLYLGVISMQLRVFSKGRGTELGVFFGVAKFQIFFLGCLKS